MEQDDFLVGLLRGAVPEVKDEFDQTNRATQGNLSGEKRLIMALLEMSVEDFHRGHHAPSMHRNCQHCEAERWFRDEDETWPLSFVVVCDHLGLQPQAVRAEVLGKERAA